MVSVRLIRAGFGRSAEIRGVAAWAVESIRCMVSAVLFLGWCLLIGVSQELFA